MTPPHFLLCSAAEITFVTHELWETHPNHNPVCAIDINDIEYVLLNFAFPGLVA